MVTNETSTDVLQKESDNEAGNVETLQSKRILKGSTSSNERTISEIGECAINENVSNKNKGKKRHFSSCNTQMWDQLNKNQAERFQVIQGLLQQPNETQSVDNKRHPIFKFFESLADTVTNFSPDLIAETRAKVAQVVTDMELRQISRYSQPVMPLQRHLPNEDMSRSSSAFSSHEYSRNSAINPQIFNADVNSPEHFSGSSTPSQTSREHIDEDPQNFDLVVKEALDYL